jgi:Fe-S-cluster-containing dehydrogenase component
MSALPGTKEMTDARSQQIMLIDLDSCVRCYACEVACRQEHHLTVETASRWCQVVTIEPRRLSGQLHMDFVPVICFHCDDPMCARACPVGAISKEADGSVMVDQKTCTGCKLCVSACPYGRMFYNEVTGAAGHCDLCAGRVNAGMEPACVQHCIGGALQFVAQEELALITKGQHTLQMGKVCYTSSKWRLEGKM